MRKTTAFRSSKPTSERVEFHRSKDRQSRVPISKVTNRSPDIPNITHILGSWDPDSTRDDI